MKKVLFPLWQKENLLVKDSNNKSIESNDRFSLNESFSSNHRFLKIRSLKVKFENQIQCEDIQKKLADRHELQIRAAIVRIMKSSQIMTHQQLITRVNLFFIIENTTNFIFFFLDYRTIRISFYSIFNCHKTRNRTINRKRLYRTITR